MKFITISSKIDITVTLGLTNVDKTNYQSKVGNNLNIAPLWARTAVHIKQGKHQYPAEIAEWPTVKALEANDTFTIGRESDEANEEDQKALEEYEANKAANEAELGSRRRRKKADEAE